MAITVKHLKALTDTLAGDLAARGVSAERLAAIRPGGPDNTARDSHAWLRYYGSLRALRSNAEAMTGPLTQDEATADRVILDALAGTPANVVLGGMPLRGLVAYPKSAIALAKCHARNLEVARLLSFVEQLRNDTSEDTSTLIEAAMVEALYQHRVLAWIACTPGAGLPYPETEVDPELPTEFELLTPQVIVEICRAFDAVNWARYRFLEVLLAPDEEEDAPRRRPSWSQFFASIASEEGTASERVLRDRSLVAFMATSQLAASAQRDAIAAAKAKSPNEGD